MNNLHAHTSTSSADCDGPMHRDYVEAPNDVELASEFGDIEFTNRVFTNHCSPYAVRQLRVTVDDDGFEWHESTDEGYRAGEVRWCRDASCDIGAYRQRDIRAEEAGY